MKNKALTFQSKKQIISFALISLFVATSFLIPKETQALSDVCACYTSDNNCIQAYVPDGSHTEKGCVNLCKIEIKEKYSSSQFGTGAVGQSHSYECQLAHNLWVQANSKPAPGETAPKETKVPTVFLTPKLNVQIPGFAFSKMEVIGGGLEGIYDYATGPILTDGFVETAYIADYVTAVYRYLMGISITIAIVMVMIGGLQYVLAAGGGDVGKAKERIKNAVIGVTLLLCVYTILYVVNPELVLLNSIKLQVIPTYALSEAASEGQAIYSKGQECLFDVYGNSADAVSKQTKKVEILGHVYKVHEKALPAFQAVANKVNSHPYRVVEDGGSAGFAWRANVNATERRSMHSFGLAIDIYPTGNPNYKRKDRSVPCKTEIPLVIINAFREEGFKWGGDYKTVCDAMHFEWYGECEKGKPGWSKSSSTPSKFCCTKEINKKISKETVSSEKLCDPGLGGIGIAPGACLETKYCCTIPDGFGTKKQTVQDKLECTSLGGTDVIEGAC